MSHCFREHEIVKALEYVRLLIAACAPKVTSSLANIKTVLKKLDIESLSSCPISVDVKVMVILCGSNQILVNVLVHTVSVRLLSSAPVYLTLLGLLLDSIQNMCRLVI